MSPSRTTSNGYWAARQHMRYYQLIHTWIDQFGPGNSVVDVGSRDTPLASWGNFAQRFAVDRAFGPQVAAVTYIKADWLTVELGVRPDLILCCQVLEHLDDAVVVPFARKLLACGSRAIVSVPFMWPRGKCSSHLQDPISRSKFLSWMNADPLRLEIVEDKDARRIVAEFKGTNPVI